MKNKPFAAIDIGTNTFRLLIAEVMYNHGEGNYSIRELHSERIVTRLGEGVVYSGLIKERAAKRSIIALNKFMDILSRHPVKDISAVATSALRDAENSEDFLNKIKEITGLNIEIITGEEEAKKTAAGMLIGMNMPESALLVDIGGGSTEFIFTKQREPLSVQSIGLGVVYLADKYMKKDPPSNDDLNYMADYVSSQITPITEPFKKFFTDSTVFIGTAGTVTALAAIVQNLTRYDHKKIHNTTIPKDKIRNIYSALSSVTACERAKYLPFEPQRLDIIVPGTLILLKIIETFDFQEIIVSNYGLREGILIDLYEKSKNRWSKASACQKKSKDN